MFVLSMKFNTFINKMITQWLMTESTLETSKPKDNKRANFVSERQSSIYTVQISLSG